MAASQVCSRGVTTFPTPVKRKPSCHSSCLGFTTLPPVKTPLLQKPEPGVRRFGLTQTVLCASSDVSKLQKRRSQRGQPCPAVAAPEAPQTDSKQRLDKSVYGDKFGKLERGRERQADRDGRRGIERERSEVRRDRWGAVAALRVEVKRTISGVEGGLLTEGKRGRLQRLFDAESAMEETGRDAGLGGQLLAEAFTQPFRKGLEESHRSLEERVGRTQSGRAEGQRPKPSTDTDYLSEKRKSLGFVGAPRLESLPTAFATEGAVEEWEGPVAYRREQIASFKGGASLSPEDLAGVLQEESDIEDDIGVALDSDLASFLEVIESDPTPGPLGAEAEGNPQHGESLTGGAFSLEDTVVIQSPAKDALFTLSRDHPLPSHRNAGSTPSNLTAFLKDDTVGRRKKQPLGKRDGSGPAPSVSGLFAAPLIRIEPSQEPGAAYDPLLSVLEDASNADALVSTPTHQRPFQNQHLLRARQQKALSAAVEDETLLRRPWEVEAPRPATGPPVGLELLADAAVTSAESGVMSPEVRGSAFQPRHTKRPGGGRAWLPDKRKLYYKQKFANRWGDKESPVVENPPEDETAAAVVSGGKPEAEEDHFLFPPLPRPVPHVIAGRKKVETTPVGNFRSVPPKQRKVLPIREAAALSRGLGSGLVAPKTGSSAVTSAMRDEARGSVLQQILAADEGSVGEVLNVVASSLHGKDVSFLLHELSTRGATSRALEVLHWVEKAPRRSLRLRPGAGSYATVLGGLVREGDAKAAADFAIFTRARGKQPGTDLSGTLLTGMARQGGHAKVWEILDRMQKRGESLDGRGWRGLISACAQGNKRTELVKLVCTALDLADEGGVMLTRLDYEGMAAACAVAGLVKESLNLVEMMETKGFSVSVEVYGKVMCALSKAGLHSEVLELYRKACQESQVSKHMHNAAIRSLCQVGRQSEARELLQRMLVSGAVPDVISYNTIVGSLSRVQRQEEALELFYQMQERGFQPTPLTYKVLGSGQGS